MSNGHALLAPSSAYRWLKCTPSARAEAEWPDTATEYAAEGTKAHELAASTLKAILITKCNLPIVTQPTLSDEMCDAITTYINACFTLSGRLLEGQDPDTGCTVYVEHTYPVSFIPDCSGTPDFVVYNGDDKLAVVDFKYGKGIKVGANDNKQLMIYACAVLDHIKGWDTVKEVTLRIVQPRLNHIDTAVYTVGELRAYKRLIKVIAEEAYRGDGARYAGAHCKFCRALPLCPQMKKEVEKLEKPLKKKPEELNTDEIADLLERCEVIANWAKKVKEFALSKCLKGNTIKGLKAVEGRGIRAWTDENKALKALIDSGVEESKIYQKEPLSLAKIEKLLGKKEFDCIVSSFVTRKAGKPTLATADDSRPAITANNAKEAFK